MHKTVEQARKEFCQWYQNLWLTNGDLQVARLFVDSGREYDKLLAQEECQELE